MNSSILIGEASNNSSLENIQASKRKLSLKKTESHQELQKVGDDFEAIFIKMVVDSMRKTVDEKKNPFYGGMTEDIFGDMLYDEYATLMAQQNELGFAEAIIQRYEKNI